MMPSTKENIGFPAVGIGVLTVLMGAYAWLEGGLWPRVTESWTVILAGVGVVLTLFGLLLVWPSTPANDA